MRGFSTLSLLFFSLLFLPFLFGSFCGSGGGKGGGVAADATSARKSTMPNHRPGSSFTGILLGIIGISIANFD